MLYFLEMSKNIERSSISDCDKLFDAYENDDSGDFTVETESADIGSILNK